AGLVLLAADLVAHVCSAIGTDLEVRNRRTAGVVHLAAERNEVVLVVERPDEARCVHGLLGGARGHALTRRHRARPRRREAGAASGVGIIMVATVGALAGERAGTCEEDGDDRASVFPFHRKLLDRRRSMDASSMSSHGRLRPRGAA